MAENGENGVRVWQVTPFYRTLTFWYYTLYLAIVGTFCYLGFRNKSGMTFFDFFEFAVFIHCLLHIKTTDTILSASNGFLHFTLRWDEI